AAVVVGRRDVDQVRPRVVGGRRPVLPPPERRAEVDEPAPDRLVLGVVRRPAGRRVDARERVLPYVGLRVDERDLVGAALEHPQLRVAPLIDEALEWPPAALHIVQTRRRYLLP